MTDNVISLSKARAIKDAIEHLHSKEMREVIYDGASGEFRRIIAPVLRELLDAKDAPVEFQKNLIALLEKVYATEHTLSLSKAE